MNEDVFTKTQVLDILAIDRKYMGWASQPMFATKEYIESLIEWKEELEKYPGIWSKELKRIYIFLGIEKESEVESVL